MGRRNSRGAEGVGGRPVKQGRGRKRGQIEKGSRVEGRWEERGMCMASES